MHNWNIYRTSVLVVFQLFKISSNVGSDYGKLIEMDNPTRSYDGLEKT